MSRARMVKRRLTVVQQQRMRRMTRRNHECRVRHWRQMLRTMKCSEWMKPYDQLVRVAYVTAHCREHRNQIEISVVIPEVLAQTTHDLNDLVWQRLRDAIRTIKKMLVPQRYRREFAA